MVGDSGLYELLGEEGVPPLIGEGGATLRFGAKLRRNDHSDSNWIASTSDAGGVYDRMASSRSWSIFLSAILMMKTMDN